MRTIHRNNSYFFRICINLILMQIYRYKLLLLIQVITFDVYLIKLFCFLFSVLIALALLEFGSIPHMQSIGFFCGDPKIDFKFKGDTVESEVLILVTLIVPFLTVSLSD